MSTTSNTGDVATYVVKVNGSPIPDESRILSILVEQSTNRIPMATIVILDGDASTGKFEASSSKTFLPGSKVVIEAGYNSKNKPLFKGIITKQNIRIDSLVGSALEVVCRDESIKMIVGRKSKTYTKKKDSDIIQSIIATYSGIETSVDTTSTIWPEQVQYYVTDWDFILTRAEANGLVVNVINGSIDINNPGKKSKTIELKYGGNLHELNAELNSVNQLASVDASSWDYKTQAMVTGEASNSIAGPGDLSSKKLSEVVGLAKYSLQTAANQNSNELAEWSKAQMIKSELSKIKATAKCQGTGLVIPGKYLSLSGVGTRFNGDHYISSVTHDFSDGNWTTEIGLGLVSNWFSEEPDVMAPPASGLLPGVRGLVNGTVKKIDEDPDSQYRILVDIALFDAKGEGIWARLANFYSTSGAGAFFMPEVGDEVVVGFLNEDPRYPIILGSLYSSSKNKPFEGLDPNEKNSIKAIVSKSGINVKFDDENKILSLTTPQKNTIIFSDKDKSVSIQDENENSIKLSSDGISLSSPKNINIKANQKVSINGMQGITLDSSGGDVQLNGINIKSTAQGEFSAEGSAMAQIQGGAELTLKGAMVMIN